MIVRMKEIWLFTLASSVDETVRKLGELGVVDIREVNQPAGESMERRLEEVARAESAVNLLKDYVGKNHGDADRVKYNSEDPKRITDRVLASVDFKRHCKEKLDDLQQQLDWYKTWGEQVKTRDFKYLQERGIYIRLYRVDKTAAPSLSKDYCIAAFPERNGKIPIALFSRDKAEKLDLKEEPLPALPLREVRRRIARKKRQLGEVELYLQDQAESLDLLHDYLRFLKDRLGTQRALEGMGDIEGKLKYLKGFIPRDDVDSFQSVARRQHWGYQISEPENPEEVPVYVRNPKWVEIINPVMKFIDIVPGYKEVDVSIYFLVAFALFFAMLVGDAGYGAVFLLVTFLLRKKLSSQMRLLI